MEKRSTVPWNVVLGSATIYLGQSIPMGCSAGVLNLPVTLIKTFIRACYEERNNATSGSGGQAEQVSTSLVNTVWTSMNMVLFVGAIFGAFLVANLVDRFGRSKSSAMVQAFAFAGALVFQFGYYFRVPELFILSRFITGIHIGFAGPFGSLFLSEIAPVTARGRFLIGHQLFFTLGIFLSSVFGLSKIFGSEHLWNFTILMSFLPSVISLLMYPLIHDSPRFLLLVKNDTQNAVKSLQFYRGTEDVSQEIIEMQNEKIKYQNSEQWTMWKVLTTNNLRGPLIIGCVLQVMQQFSGINGIFFYSVSIYKNAGLQSQQVEYAVVITNFIFVIGTIASVPLLDRIGRKPLLFYTMITMIISLAIMSVSLNLKMPYVSSAMIIPTSISFALGLGGIPLLLSAELFMQGPRPYAMSIIGFVLWVSLLSISMSFEYIQAYLKDNTFVFFICCMVFFIIYTHYKIPETKNKTFEEISKFFHKKRRDDDIEHKAEVTYTNIPQH